MTIGGRTWNIVPIIIAACGALPRQDGTVRDGDLLTICSRIARNELVAAEARSLTGGRPDDDGVGVCGSVELVARAAYVRSGVRVITSGATFDELIAGVAGSQFSADGFRIDVHDPASRLERTRLDIAIALADVIPAAPDLKHPRHRFVVVAAAGRIAFGEVVAETDRSYRRHDAKPWSTSSSLDARFSRALVNLVPHVRSVLDPCCGAGSIVLEAASLGLEASGADWKPAMVGMTRENLAHFGYVARVDRIDSRVAERRADAIVTDLPYGHAIQTDEPTVRAILERGASRAPIGVYVAPHDISGWLDAAGYDVADVHRVVKRAGFTRWVHVATSREAQ